MMGWKSLLDSFAFLLLPPVLPSTPPPSSLLQVLERDKERKVPIFMEFCYWWERQILNRPLNYQVEIKEPSGVRAWVCMLAFKVASLRASWEKCIFRECILVET